MTIEEFWDKYENEDILEVFDEACELFSKELPDYATEEYDIEEILLEVRGHQESAKNFDNVLKFTQVIKENHPELYKEVFPYFDDFLVDYNCFMQDEEKVKEAFSNFIEHPTQDVDSYFIQLNRLLFYQYSDIIEKAANRNYSGISESDGIIDGAEFDLAFIKMYTTLQNVFESKGENPGISSFIDEMKGYDFEFKDSFASSVETGLFKIMLDTDSFNELFKKDKEKAFMVLRFSFLRYMHSQSMPFYVSAKITDQLPSYWYKENKTAKTADAFFKLETNSFGDFINGLSGDFYTSNESESIAVLWGSVYFYEFLLKQNYITQNTFDSFIETSRVLKGRMLSRYLPDLWKSNFVHMWPKPACISETEFTQEHNIFKKSIKLKYKSFEEQKTEISDELEMIGELANHIIVGAKEFPKMDTSLLDSFFDPQIQQSQFTTNCLAGESSPRELNRVNENTDIPYIREEKKVGRNEPCPCGSEKKYKKCCG